MRQTLWVGAALQVGAEALAGLASAEAERVHVEIAARWLGHKPR